MIPQDAENTKGEDEYPEVPAAEGDAPAAAPAGEDAPPAAAETPAEAPAPAPAAAVAEEEVKGEPEL